MYVNTVNPLCNRFLCWCGNSFGVLRAPASLGTEFALPLHFQKNSIPDHPHNIAATLNLHGIRRRLSWDDSKMTGKGLPEPWFYIHVNHLLELKPASDTLNFVAPSQA